MPEVYEFPTKTPVDVLDSTTGDARYIKLDQTTPQSMEATGKWAFVWVNPDTLQLYVNGALRHSWTTAYVAPDLTGQPMGMLLTLTYPS
jgi:hypothetical protein